MQEKTDAELIKAALESDPHAFGALVARHSRDVYGFAFFLAKSQPDAEDISQETFVKVWKNLHKFKPEQRFKSWLLAIAHNTAVDYLRKRRSAVFSDFEDDEGANMLVESLADEEKLADELSALAESGEKAKKAADELPDIYREVIALRYQGDLSFEEIATALKKSVNTIKSQHRRALIALRKVLGPEDGGSAPNKP